MPDVYDVLQLIDIKHPSVTTHNLATGEYHTQLPNLLDPYLELWNQTMVHFASNLSWMSIAILKSYNNTGLIKRSGNATDGSGLDCI